MALLVIGSEAEGATGSSIKKERAYAFPFTAKNTSVVEVLKYRTGAIGTATSVRVGICADEGGKPGALLGSEVVVTPGSAKETTYEATGLNAPITGGQKYWLVVLPIGGEIKLKINTTPAESETAWRSAEGIATVAGASGWAVTSGATLIGNPVFIAGRGNVTINLVEGRGGGGGSIAGQAIRQIGLVAGRGGGGGTVITPGEVGVKLAAGHGGGGGSASVKTIRSIALAAGHGGGSGTVTPPNYGAAEVFAYGSSIWRVVQPYRAVTPGSPVIIFLHESSHDEPGPATAAEVLPKPGETLFAIRPVGSGGNGKQLSTTPYAEKANENGFACFVPAYRPILEGSPGNNAAQYSSADVDALIAWVKQHAAAWNGDPSKVCIIGGSFGVTIGFHEALKLNSEKGDSRYIVACAGLSGPVNIPSRIKGRAEEIAALAAWEAAHPGFTEAEREAWKVEHKYANTDIISKLAQYIGVAESHLKEVGWLERGGAEEKAALKLAEELSATQNLSTMSATMPAIWYSISDEDLTPQQQGEEMSEAAAAHGQPGKYHFHPNVGKEHAFGFYSTVEAEIYAYFRQALNPAVVNLAAGRGGGSGTASVSTTRRLSLAAGHGGGGGNATIPQTSRVAVVAGRGGGAGSALVTTTRQIASIAGRGGGRGVVSITLPPIVGRGGGSGHVTLQVVRKIAFAVGRGGGRGSATGVKSHVVLFPTNAPVAGQATVGQRGRIAG